MVQINVRYATFISIVGSEYQNFILSLPQSPAVIQEARKELTARKQYRR